LTGNESVMYSHRTTITGTMAHDHITITIIPTA
jgi:hypothetical protein